jgi:prepilin-type N-terminal cleavage/methylation domain-containing protein
MSGAMRDERGFSLPELLVSVMVFGIVLTAILQMVTVTIGNQARISQHVSANQRGRPVMTQLMNNLRSSCVTSGVAPVQVGSSATSISFLSKSGSSVNPVPDKRIVTLSGTTLTETVYAPTGGTAAAPTFSATPSSNRVLMTNIAGAVSVAGTTLPIFRYYSLGYVNNKLTTVPLSVPLTTAGASTATVVDVAFRVMPSRPDVRSTTEGISFSDSATLRLEAGSPDVSRPNLPCA